MALKVDISVGEFLDKMTILEIKSERIQDPVQLGNVNKELNLLQMTWADSTFGSADVSGKLNELKSVNEMLWDIEDQIRRKESAQSFDDDFVRLARSVYQTNDRRAAIKRQLNRLLGSDLIEEKSYPDYTPPSK
jgi:hypothetical protein